MDSRLRGNDAGMAGGYLDEGSEDLTGGFPRRRE